MSSTIMEGVGDEVIILIGLAVLIAFVAIAWYSTQVRSPVQPGSVWLVHMQEQGPNQRVLQVFEYAENSPQIPADPTAAEVGSRNPIRERIGMDLLEERSEASGSSSILVQNPENLLSAEIPEENFENSPDENFQLDESNQIPPPPNQIRLKFLDDTQRLVRTWLDRTVGEFKRQHFMDECRQGKVVRLIFNGQLLRDEQTLESYGLREDSVLHCHISQTPIRSHQSNGGHSSEAAGGQRSGPGFSPGHYLHWILATKFVLLWISWLLYPAYFDFSSLFTLFMATVIFAVFWYAGMRRNQQELQQQLQMLQHSNNR